MGPIHVSLRYGEKTLLSDSAWGMIGLTKGCGGSARAALEYGGGKRMLDWWNVSVFGIIPFLSVAVLFAAARKLLWTAPFVSAALSAAVTLLAMPEVLAVQEWRNIFFGISLPIHFLTTVLLTVIAYGAAYLWKRWKQSCRGQGRKQGETE